MWPKWGCGWGQGSRFFCPQESNDLESTGPVSKFTCYINFQRLGKMKMIKVNCDM